MTDDELEQERAALLAELDGKPLTEDLKRRVAAVMAADMARPKPPLLEAVRDLLAEAHAMTDRVVPPGLSVRDFEADPLEVLSADGDVYTRIPKQSLFDRAKEIEAGRRAN